MTDVQLSGLDGTNPLGFLAALGTLRTLGGGAVTGPPMMGWDPTTWHPIVRVSDASSPEDLVQLLGDRLRRTPGEGAGETAAVKAAFDEARTRVKKVREKIKRQRLPRDEARATFMEKLQPLQEQRDRLRDTWRACLTKSAPDAVVSLGANLTVLDQDFREFCAAAARASTPNDRTRADFSAAFGCEYGTADPSSPMRATPLALIRGDSHQDFLGSVAELMVRCTVGHLRSALLGPWSYDEKYSLRWDPAEDRRYALMARDPTASGNKPTSVWGANRLAFEALPLFPCVPTIAGMRTVCVAHEGARIFFSWPLWQSPLALDSIRSLLGVSDIVQPDADAVRRLRARGVRAVYRTERIAVGSGANKKFSFTPAAPLWS